MKKLFLLSVLGCAVPLLSAPQDAHGRQLPVKPVGLKWPTIQGGPYWNEAGFEPAVAAIQHQLRARGFFKGKADGLYGPKTVAAVKAFQKSRGLFVDGVVGPQTLPRLVIPVKRGSKGDGVRAAQILARRATDHDGGMPNVCLELDGIYGKVTEEAVRTYQACLYMQEPPVAETGVMDLRAWSGMLYDFQPERPLRSKPTKNLLTKPLVWPTLPSNGEEWNMDDHDPALQAVQYLLRSRGFYKGAVDGLPGKKTTASIRSFQRARRLPVTGVAKQRELQLLIVPLRQGAKGDSVRAAQILARAISDANYRYSNLGLEADGVYGTETATAIRRAQQGLNRDSQIVPVDGLMSARTWCLMMGRDVVGVSY